MFESVGWGEILVLVLVGLFVLGPERLPAAIRWVGQTVRTVRDYATGARDQLRDELGPEYADLQLRDLDPRVAVRKQIMEAMAEIDEEEDERPKPRPGQLPLLEGEVPPYDDEAT